MMKTVTKLWIGIGALAVLSPLGIFLPDRFKAGSAWGEWGAGEFSGLVGYIPKGLEKLSSLWKAPLPDYAIRGIENHPAAAYLISALIGVAVCAGVVYVSGRFLARKKGPQQQDDHGEKNKRIS
jgi:cobalt/nickel transport protein